MRVPPETAFAYVADITYHNECTVDEIKITPLTTGHVGLGSQYTGVGQQGGKDWPSDLEVTAYEPPHRFEFTATNGPMGTPASDPHRNDFLFNPQNGGTLLEIRRTDPAPPNWPEWRLKFTAFIIMHFLIKSTRVKTLERLKARLDELAGTP